MNSIAVILQPHTPSLSPLAVAHAMANLMAMNFGGSGLDQVLSAAYPPRPFPPWQNKPLFQRSSEWQRSQKCMPTHTGACTSLATIPSVCASLSFFSAPVLLSHRLQLSRRILTPESQALRLLGVLTLVMNCISDHSTPALGVATPFGTLPGLTQAFTRRR